MSNDFGAFWWLRKENSTITELIHTYNDNFSKPHAAHKPQTSLLGRNMPAVIPPTRLTWDVYMLYEVRNPGYVTTSALCYFTAYMQAQCLWFHSPISTINTAITCPHLTPPLNGHIEGTCSNTYGNYCELDCDSGYVMMIGDSPGDSTVSRVQCQSSASSSSPCLGVWHGRRPTCTGESKFP